MSKWNNAISVTFNDNDGKVGWSANPVCLGDLLRHQRIFGKYRTRWILFKRFWTALMWMEERIKPEKEIKTWVFKAEIPE